MAGYREQMCIKLDQWCIKAKSFCLSSAVACRIHHVLNQPEHFLRTHTERERKNDKYSIHVNDFVRNEFSALGVFVVCFCPIFACT